MIECIVECWAQMPIPKSDSSSCPKQMWSWGKPLELKAATRHPSTIALFLVVLEFRLRSEPLGTETKAVQHPQHLLQASVCSRPSAQLRSSFGRSIGDREGYYSSLNPNVAEMQGQQLSTPVRDGADASNPNASPNAEQLSGQKQAGPNPSAGPISDLTQE